MLVKKRNGDFQEFNPEKIVNAICAANEEVQETNKPIIEIAKRIAKDIKKETKDKEYITIEEIQDLVEEKLMGTHMKKTARAYIRYRYDREKIRDSKTQLMSAVGEKLMATNVENQNANLDEKSFGGRMGEANRVVVKQYALDNCMSEMAKSNHVNNRIYIHDLDSYAVGMHNCLTVPIDDLLAKGFNTRQTDVRPAASINTAFQLVAVLFQIQSLQQFGGVSASHIDWSMVPYVRMSFTKHLGDGLAYIEGQSEYKVNRFHKWLKHDPKHPDGTIHLDDETFKNLHPKAWEYALDMTERECHQAVEGMYHNLNTLQSRSGNQLPFSSINYGTCILPEGRMVTKAILEVSIEGLGALHRTSIFPCGIFQCMKGVNREPWSPNYDLYRLALKSTAKRLYPNYANVDWSTNIGYDKNDPKTYVSTMGKRKLSPCKTF